MKNLKSITTAILIAAVAVTLTACGSKEQPAENTAEIANAIPYPLDTCLVCGMKLSMMSKFVTFAHQGQQIKVCDAGEKVDFEKDPAKYLKKLADAEVQIKK